MNTRTKTPTLKQIEQAEAYADSLAGLCEWQFAYEKKLKQILNVTEDNKGENNNELATSAINHNPAGLGDNFH